MNELQKEYYERQAKEQAEREAAEEARLKAFMEEERRKDAERKFKEEINKAEQEEKERLAAEEAERKAEEEAAEIISRMKAKIHEDRAKEKAQEEKASETQKSDGQAVESKASESVGSENNNTDTKKTDAGISGDIPIEMVDEETDTQPDHTEDKQADKPETESKSKAAEPVKEVVKPASEGAKKQGGPKFKKGGKKGKNQPAGRPKPVEEPEIPKANESDLSQETLTDSVQSKSQEKETQKTAVEESTQENTQTKVDHDKNNETEPEVVNLEGTVEPAEEETVANTDESSDVKTNPASEDTDSEDGIHKMTPENKAASDEAAKWKEAAEEAQDRYKRLLAEFENARAREAKEAAQKFDLGAKSVLEKLLPVVDNFERAIQTIPEEDRERAFEQGVDKIYKQMMTVLEDIGVAPMNAEGTEFNPDLHNAVMHIEDDSLGENVVAEEMQKGYMYKDSVLRYSMVKVAN